MNVGTTPQVSIVSPVYGCKICLVELYLRVKNTVEKITNDFEIILINDNSPDDAWSTIVELSKKDARVKGVKFSRNFGQHYAINAGLSYSRGEWVVVMDCDLQDKPEEIEQLYVKALDGYDVVLACRSNRQDNFFKRMGSHYFYKTLAYLTDTKQNPEVANFGIYHRKVINALLGMQDKIKYFPAMVKWVGFKQIEIPVIHAERQSGSSSYNLKRLLMLALNTILSFSDKPLRLVVKLGVSISALSFLFAIYIFVMSVTGHIQVLGYASLIMSIWFLSGVIITIMGVLGLYVGRIFEQVKDRPVFIVSDTTNI